MSRCAPFVQGVLAFQNSSLIANGSIPETGTVRGEEVRVVPASRIAIELQYSVRADSGTTLNDLAGGVGVGGIFGGLGGGSGFLIGQAIGSGLLGDFEPTRSQFIFHLTEAETRVNRSITLSEEFLESARNSLDGEEENDFALVRIQVRDYIIGVLGVTRTPIAFTDEEIESIGSSPGAQRGWTVDQNGAIIASFEDFNPSGPENLFVQRVVDERKYDFRGDNYQDRQESNVFTNNGSDDLVERIVELRIPASLLADSDRGPGDPLPEDPAEARAAPLIPGDKLYITYEAATNRFMRHAIFASSFFFLFPGPLVERIGEDQVKAWTYRPYEFKILKTHNVFAEGGPVRADCRDLVQDEEVLADPELTAEQKDRRLRLENIEVQRLVEVLADSKNDRPFIKGFYTIDDRGIISVDGGSGQNEISVLVPREDINDQQWFDNLLASFITSRPGYENGELVDVERATATLRGFLFDVSPHVNATVFDNEKFGYQRDLAEALALLSKPDPEDETKGGGVPNLDLIQNRVVGRDKYDLSSAVFEPFRMSSVEGGAYFIRDCNKFFVDPYIQADMFIRTPFFFDRFGDDTRIYVERFSPQFPLERDGGIWVFSSPAAFGERMTVNEHPFNRLAYLVFNADNADGESTLRFLSFEDAILRNQLQRTDHVPEDINRVHEPTNIDNANQLALAVVGYDQILGNQPGYSLGKEISVDEGLIALGKARASETYELSLLSFSQQDESDTITVSGLADRKVKSIKLTFKIKDGEAARFKNETQRLFAIVFPNQQAVIDNIAFPWVGGVNENRIETVVIDTRNYSDQLFRINGEIWKYVQLLEVEATVFTEDGYNASKIVSNISSTCFDDKGNWYIFYEDELAFEGDFGDQPGNVDEGGTKEISCLFSPDEGHTWVTYKGIVQTAEAEDISTPFAVVDQIGNKIHLFFLLNDTLMHKLIDPKQFNVSDAFKAYKRPSNYFATSDAITGFAHFSEDGQKMRLSPLHVVIGNVSGEYLTDQLALAQIRRENDLNERIVLDGDAKDFEEGFVSQDYYAYQNNKGGLVVIYAVNGAVFVRVSNDEGKSWEEAYISEEEILIHKNANIQEPREISQLGGVYNPLTGVLNLTYTVDEMLFVKTFDGGIFDKSATDLPAFLDAETATSKPIFIAGTIPDELLAPFISGESDIVFPYGLAAIAAFDESMGVSDNIPTVGYTSSSGITRMFYKDALGNVRGLSYDTSDVQLDTKKRGING